MIGKDEILEAIESLPDDATASNATDAIERLYVIEAIEEGIAQMDGRGIPHEEARRRMAKWLK